MRCSTASSCRRPDRRGFARRAFAGRAGAAALAFGLSLGAGACVTRSAHEAALERARAENERLSEALLDERRTIEAQDRERERLLAEIEDLRDARESLRADVAARDRKLRELRERYDALVRDLEADVAASQLRIEQLTEGLTFSLPAGVLFAAGSAQLSSEGRRAVEDVARRIPAGDARVEVQGHTDDRPIGGALAARYPTNWELAGARAAAVVRVLEKSGVDPKRLAAVSLGATRPLASNESPEGRAQNRRIEVRVLPSPRTPLPEAPPQAREGAAPSSAGAAAGAGAAPTGGSHERDGAAPASPPAGGVGDAEPPGGEAPAGEARRAEPPRAEPPAAE